MSGFTRLMNKFIKEKLYDFERLNAEIANFQYAHIDSKSKTPPGVLKQSKKQLKLSATHAWTLTRILPLILGSRFQSNVYYMHYMSLIEITRLLTDDTYDDAKLADLTQRIYTYLTEFKELYPGEAITAKNAQLSSLSTLHPSNRASY